MFSSYLELEKKVFTYFEPDKHCCSYLKREKSGSLLFGDQKMQFTTVRSKEKDYDIYIKSEKLVHSNFGDQKMQFTKKIMKVRKTSQQLGARKKYEIHSNYCRPLERSGRIKRFLPISSLTNTVAAI